MVTPRRCYWECQGQWLLEVKYGNVVVELCRDCPSIVAGPERKAVLATLKLIRDAVEGGEADEAIEAAAARAKRKPYKRLSAPPPSDNTCPRVTRGFRRTKASECGLMHRWRATKLVAE
jgi:hypothetical protein